MTEIPEFVWRGVPHHYAGSRTEKKLDLPAGSGGLYSSHIDVRVQSATVLPLIICHEGIMYQILCVGQMRVLDSIWINVCSFGAEDKFDHAYYLMQILGLVPKIDPFILQRCVEMTVEMPQTFSRTAAEYVGAKPKAVKALVENALPDDYLQFKAHYVI